MQKFVIEGGIPLRGEVTIGGAKNAVLPIMAACLLADGPVRLRNVPELGDIATLVEILRGLGMRVERTAPETLELETVDLSASTAPYELVRQMRGSICVLGPLLARRRQAVVALPGGCSIGVRPVDLHIKAMKALGATVDVEEGYIKARADRLKGDRVVLTGPNGPTVLGTGNLLMAASLATGRTVIEFAAREPEVQDLANFLNAMGAQISGIGTTTMTIDGVESLHGVDWEVIPDRIEAGTFMVAAAITRGNVLVQRVREDHLGAMLDALGQIGVSWESEAGAVRVTATRPFEAIELTTDPYPGFPTDLQAQVLALLTLARGTSFVTDSIFPERFAHVGELIRLRANIRKSGNSAIVTGVEYLSGAPVEASDLRGAASLVLAGLVARGETIVSELQHLDRGYQAMEDKLRALGARIQRITV